MSTLNPKVHIGKAYTGQLYALRQLPRDGIALQVPKEPGPIKRLLTLAMGALSACGGKR